MTQGRIRALTKPKLLAKMSGKGLLGEIIAFMDGHLDDAVKQMKQYPPPKADSKYVRTYVYMNSWLRTDVRLVKDGLIGNIESDAVDPYGAHYSELVGGDDAGAGQLAMHATTGWTLMAEVLRTGYIPGLKRVIKEALE